MAQVASRETLELWRYIGRMCVPSRGNSFSESNLKTATALRWMLLARAAKMYGNAENEHTAVCVRGWKAGVERGVIPPNSAPGNSTTGMRSSASRLKRQLGPCKKEGGGVANLLLPGKRRRGISRRQKEGKGKSFISNCFATWSPAGGRKERERKRGKESRGADTP